MATTSTTTKDAGEASTKAAPLSVGQVVEYTYRDDYAGAGGADVTVAGIVTGITTIGSTDEAGKVTDVPAATVAWLPSTDPIDATLLSAL